MGSIKGKNFNLDYIVNTQNYLNILQIDLNGKLLKIQKL